MAEGLSDRQQRAAERILEDEGLTEELTDIPARALITWASEQASTLAGEEIRSDEELAAALKELRKAVRVAAASGESDPTTLVAQAQATLNKALGTASLPSDTAKQPSSASETKETLPDQGANQPGSAAETDNAQQSIQAEKETVPKGEEQPASNIEKEKNRPNNGEIIATLSGPPPLVRVPDPPARKAAMPSNAPVEEQWSTEEQYTNWLDDITHGERD